MSFGKSETYSNIVLFVKKKSLLINILWGNPTPNNRPYSFGKGVVNIVQILHRDVHPGIVQSSNQIISQTCSIMLRSGDWDDHWMVDLSCSSNHATVQRAVWAGALSCWNTTEWILSPNYVFYRIKKVSRQCSQCSNIIVHIHVIITNDQIANRLFFSIPSCQYNDKAIFVQILACRRRSDKPSLHPMIA